jgi:RNA polymerase sigma-70 factor (ECF subfamily)
VPLPERDEPQQATGAADGAGRAHWMRRVLERAFARMLPATLDPAREDLVQTAVVRVLERGEREKDPVRTASYLWKVAFTVIADELRRRRRAGEESVDDAALEAHLHEVRGVEPPRPVGVGVALRDCLQRLSSERRGAVVLHLQGFAAPEAARVLRTGEKRVQNLTYRGLADLRNCLTRKGLSP